MEESASNLINFYTNRIEELKTQLDKSNNKIEKMKTYAEYLIKNMGLDSYYMEKIYLEKHIKKFLSIIDEENK